MAFAPVVYLTVVQSGSSTFSRNGEYCTNVIKLLSIIDNMRCSLIRILVQKLDFPTEWKMISDPAGPKSGTF